MAKAKAGKPPATAKAKAGRPPATAKLTDAARGETVIALDIPSAGPLSETSRGYLDTCVEKLGFVPNVLKAYAFDEVKLSAFIAMHDDLMLGDSGLGKLEREMIAVVVSAANRCHYCLVAHGAAVRKRSGDPALGELMAMSYRAADLTPRHRAMLDFAWRLTSAPFEVGEADREALRAAGFSDRDIWDIAAVAGFFNMSNRMATATGMKPNEEYTYLARSAVPLEAPPPPRPAAAPRRSHKAGAPGIRRRRKID
jgi:uncharacterized peroxidase-related enzyme